MPTNDVQAPARWHRWSALGLSIGLALSLMTISPTAAAIPPPPPNPTDDEIAASENRATLTAEEVGRLSGELSKTQTLMQQLQNNMELKAELAMKALVDLQMAQEEVTQTVAAAAAAQQEADAATEDITLAQTSAAAFAAASFRQGAPLGSMAALLGVESMDQLIARRAMIDQVSASQSHVVSRLQTARATKANLDSQARAAVAAAQEAETEAEAAQVAALEAQAAAEYALEEGQTQLATLEAKFEAQQLEYQEALNSVTELKGQRAQYEAWLVEKRAEEARIAEQERRQKLEAEAFLRERAQAATRVAQEDSKRSSAVSKERQRQEELRLERERKLAQEQAKKEGKKLGSDGALAVPQTERAKIVVASAMKWLGTPYAWGGGNSKGPTYGIRDGGVADRYGDYKKIGFDCSGLVLYAYGQVGINLPHYSGYQYNYGKRISRANLQPGDLVFWARSTSNPATIHHVAIYLGNNQMIEAPQSGSYVKISPMRWNGYIGATRPGT